MAPGPCYSENRVHRSLRTLGSSEPFGQSTTQPHEAVASAAFRRAVSTLQAALRGRSSAAGEGPGRRAASGRAGGSRRSRPLSLTCASVSPGGMGGLGRAPGPHTPAHGGGRRACGPLTRLRPLLSLSQASSWGSEKAFENRLLCSVWNVMRFKYSPCVVFASPGPSRDPPHPSTARAAPGGGGWA